VTCRVVGRRIGARIAVERWKRGVITRVCTLYQVKIITVMEPECRTVYVSLEECTVIRDFKKELVI